MVPATTQKVLLLLLAALAGALCLYIVWPFLIPLTAATALAILFYPLYQWIRRLVRSANLSAALAVALILFLTLVPLAALSAFVGKELRDLYTFLADKSKQGGGWEPWLLHLLEKPLAWLGLPPNGEEFNLRAMALERIQSASAFLIGLLRRAIGNLAETLFDVVVTMFALFFLLRDGHIIRRWARETLPLDPEAVESLFTDVGASVIANVYGIVAVAVAQGALTGLAFLVLGLPSPVLWGLVAGLLSMIPMVGPPLVWAPAAVYLAVSGSWVKALVLVGLGVGVIGLADNLIRPYVISERVKLHPLLVFFALLGGVKAFGLTGMFIGPAALSVTVALASLWGSGESRRQGATSSTAAP